MIAGLLCSAISRLRLWIIAMHEAARLRVGDVRDEAQRKFDHVPAVATRIDAEMPAQEPVAEQFHFRNRLGRIEDRQVVGRHALLHAQHRIERIAVKFVDAAVVQFRQIRAIAEIFHQHEAVRQIDGEHLRRVQSRRAQSRTDIEPRPHVFLRGRRVHHDPGLVARRRAPVTAETGVGGGDGKFEHSPRCSLQRIAADRPVRPDSSFMRRSLTRRGRRRNPRNQGHANFDAEPLKIVQFWSCIEPGESCFESANSRITRRSS